MFPIIAPARSALHAYIYMPCGMELSSIYRQYIYPPAPPPTGDLMHADGGSDFIGGDSKSGNVYYNARKMETPRVKPFRAGTEGIAIDGTNKLMLYSLQKLPIPNLMARTGLHLFILKQIMEALVQNLI